MTGMRHSRHAGEVRIDKGIPIPNYLAGRYPFGKMKVGDSFLLMKGDGPGVVRRAGRETANNGERFVVLKVKAKAYRCWRTK
jgi:hypothetical protein